MLFSVIYSVDCPKEVPLRNVEPPQKRKLWEITESGPSEFDDTWKHRKYCAILTREQFTQFVEHCYLSAENCETMGSIGALGFGFGWAPAISFNGNDCDAYQNAYVTPIVELRHPERENNDMTEKQWQRLRRAVINMYS